MQRGAKSPHLGPISFILMQLSRNIWPNDRLIPLSLGFTHPVWDMLALPLAPVSCEISLTQLYLATRMTTDRVRLLLMPLYSNIAIFKGIFIDFVKIISSKDNHQQYWKCIKVGFFSILETSQKCKLTFFSPFSSLYHFYQIVTFNHFVTDSFKF